MLLTDRSVVVSYVTWPCCRTLRCYLTVPSFCYRRETVRMSSLQQSLQSVVQPHHAQPQTHRLQTVLLRPMRPHFPTEDRHAQTRRNSSRARDMRRDFTKKCRRRTSRNDARRQRSVPRWPETSDHNSRRATGGSGDVGACAAHALAVEVRVTVAIIGGATDRRFAIEGSELFADISLMESGTVTC